MDSYEYLCRYRSRRGWSEEDRSQNFDSKAPSAWTPSYGIGRPLAFDFSRPKHERE